MEFTDIQEKLNVANLEALTSQTYLGTYRVQGRDSLLKDGLGTRANSIWKMAQYIIATFETRENPIEDYLSGWRTLVKHYKNQFLIIQTDKEGHDWEVYDSNCKKLGGVDYIESLFRETNVGSKQIVYYGCPGSGKSRKVKDKIEKVHSDFKFRTTFHPDTDYASFVGCYKPTSIAGQVEICDIQELTSVLTKMRESDITHPIHKFAADYWASLKELSGADKQKLVKDAGFTDSMVSEMNKLISVGEYIHGKHQSAISYKFRPQVFTKAYIKAWTSEENVYLIIEEINRGNCAQIFGDLFQLLDRDRETGESEYPVKADKDLADYLKSVLGADHEGIKNGELKLPSNLIIYATMNTSDQSLFPMDSAFKRRWDWEYEPIEYGASKQSYDYIITIGEKKYRWVNFLKIVNEHISESTRSEDKQMGNFFIKKSVDAKEFVNKVMFYLWNEVCKEEYGTSRNFFRKAVEGNAEGEEFKFVELFEADKAENLLLGFMKHLKVVEYKPETENA